MQRRVTRNSIAKNHTSGKFTAQNVEIQETRINNLVLRIVLEKPTSKSPLNSIYRPKELRRTRGRPRKIKRMANRSLSKSMNERLSMIMDTKFEGTVNLNQSQQLANTAVRQYRNTKKREDRFYLSFKPVVYRQVSRKLKYSFAKLINEVKRIKLPNTSWKIKIAVNKNRVASKIIFTNTKELERCIKINANSDLYELIIDNKPAVLLGSPLTIDSVTDLEVFIDIVQNIDSTNPMIFYTPTLVV